MTSPRPELTREELQELLGEGWDSGGLRRVEWPDFQAHLADEWQAGQHVSIFAPTDGGKTYLIRHGLLPLWQRYPVLWVRFKPRDSTLRGFGRQVREFPTWDQRLRYSTRGEHSPRWQSDPEWFVIVLPAYRWSPDGKRESEQWQRARRIAGVALDKAYREGGWVVVIDEVRAFADGKEPALSLSSVLENNWQRGRDQPLTVVAATQQPVSAPTSMYDQPRWVFLGRTLDTGRYQRIGELGGHTEAIKAALPGLRRFEFLAVDRWSGDMWIVRVPERGRRAA